MENHSKFLNNLSNANFQIMNILINTLIALSLTFGAVRAVNSQPTTEKSGQTTTSTVVNDDHTGMQSELQGCKINDKSCIDT